MNRNFIDLIGQNFGRLIVIKRMDNDKCGNLCWLCRCDCGKYTVIQGGHLGSNNTKSCGCLATEQLIKRSTKHGHSCKNQESKEYIVWKNMIQRCTNTRCNQYGDYGGRGIKVCKRWLKFENFLEDMDIRKKGLTLDRIDNDGDYCQENCRWVTRKQNNRNKRNNHLITHDGKTQCLKTWEEETGIHYVTILARLRYGWSIAKTLMTPVHKKVG